MSGTARIVVVEDDASVAELVTLYLRNAGFIVEHAPTGARARRLFDEVKPALVVLDLGLPDADGIDLLKELRAKGDTPVIALTARAEEAQRIGGLDAGMDDYMTKPFNPRELVARIKAILRRARVATPAAPGLEVDVARRVARVDGQAVQLTRTEFEILAALAREPGTVVDRAALLGAVWGPGYDDDHLVDVHVANLRRKLGDSPEHPRFVETVRGVGYRLAGS